MTDVSDISVYEVAFVVMVSLLVPWCITWIVAIFFLSNMHVLLSMSSRDPPTS